MRPIEHYYTLLEERDLEDTRFRLRYRAARFILRNVDEAPDLDKLLLNLFQHLIDRKVAGNSKFSAVISHPDLHHPVSIPFRPAGQNTAHAILVELKKYQESGDIINFFEGPVTIELVRTLQGCSGHGSGHLGILNW